MKVHLLQILNSQGNPCRLSTKCRFQPSISFNYDSLLTTVNGHLNSKIKNSTSEPWKNIFNTEMFDQ